MCTATSVGRSVADLGFGNRGGTRPLHPRLDPPLEMIPYIRPYDSAVAKSHMLHIIQQ